MFFGFKEKIKEAYLEKYGSLKEFCEIEGFSESDVCTQLNPSKNVSLKTLYRYMEKLDLEIVVQRKLIERIKKPV